MRSKIDTKPTDQSPPKSKPEGVLRDKGQQLLGELERRRKLHHDVVHQVQELQEDGAQLVVLPHLPPDKLLHGGHGHRRRRSAAFPAGCCLVLSVLVAAARAPGPELWCPIRRGVAAIGEESTGGG